MLGESLLALLEAAANALDAAGIRHALVGGAALPAWGRIRATGDADVLISAGLGSPEIKARLQEIVAALRGGGFAHLDRADRRRIEDKTVLHFWFPLRPQGISVRLDLIAGEGPEYDELLDRAVRRKINGFDNPRGLLRGPDPAQARRRAGHRPCRRPGSPENQRPPSGSGLPALSCGIAKARKEAR